MLVFPTLNLYTYDIRAGLGQNYADIQKNRAYFKSKLPPLSQADNELFDNLDKECETESLELLGKKKKVIRLSLESNFPKHEGYYYPVRINDSYGLLLNCSLLENQKTNDLTWLNSLQKLVAESVSNQTGTLGETWFFSAQLENLEQSEELATKIYQALMPDANATENKIGKSDFFNGEIFEFTKFDEDKHHVIITFYKEKSNLDNENKFFKDWMRLLFYRHKITWAYNQSRQLVNKLKKGAIDIQTTEQEIQNHFDKNKFNSEQLQEALNKAWSNLSHYEIHLDQLNSQIHTIDINLGNYQKRLKTLSKKSASSLTVFEKFHYLAKEKYCLQVQKDYEAFSPKLRRLDNIIKYIQASIAIREETRDRELLHTATFLGVGLATGAIVSSIIEQAPLIDNNTDSWQNFSISLGISSLSAIGAAILAVLLMKGIIWLKQKK